MARIDWIQTTLVIAGIILGSLTAMIVLAAVHDRLNEDARSRTLWLILSFVPGAALPLAIVESVLRLARWWACRDGA